MVFRATVIAMLGSLLVLHIESEIRSAHHHGQTAAAQQRAAAPQLIVRSPRRAVPMPAGTVVVDARRSEIARLLDGEILEPGARLVPTVADGELVGLKLFALDPRGVLAALGFQNGDTLLAINDRPMGNPGSAFEVYQTIADNRFLDISLRRRGEKLRMVVLIHD